MDYLLCSALWNLNLRANAILVDPYEPTNVTSRVSIGEAQSLHRCTIGCTSYHFTNPCRSPNYQSSSLPRLKSLHWSFVPHETAVELSTVLAGPMLP